MEGGRRSVAVIRPRQRVILDSTQLGDTALDVGQLVTDMTATTVEVRQLARVLAGLELPGRTAVTQRVVPVADGASLHEEFLPMSVDTRQLVIEEPERELTCRFLGIP